MTQRRNRRSGVEDRWRKADGSPSANDQSGRRWRARYVDESGREHSRSFNRKVDAQNFLNSTTAAQESGTWVDPRSSATEFRSLAEIWFATKATRSPKTVAGYRSLLDTQVLPRWGDSLVGEITYTDIQEWVTGLSADGGNRFTGKGLSASRVIQAHQVLNQILRYAVRAKLIGANPATEIELPRKVEEERKYLTHAQVQQLAMAAGEYRTLVLVLSYCGLRFGEAIALRAGSVEVKRRRIRVSRSVTRVDGQGMVEGSTKNHTARSVPVPAFVMDLLASDINGLDAAELVFGNARGSYLSVGQFRWAFDRAATSVGLELVPHELRHTAASLAIRAGANVKVVQKMLGHKTATLTLDRYGHLFADDLDAVGEALNRAAAEFTADCLRTGG